MTISNLVAFFIILTTAATLHANGTTNIESTEQAAEARRPIAGDAAFVLFSLGLIGTGLLAIPVLAGSAAYAIGEVWGCAIGPEKTWKEATRFYSVIGLSIVVGKRDALPPIDPIRALIWSAVLNGVIVVPIVAAMMIIGARRDLMGEFVVAWWRRIWAGPPSLKENARSESLRRAQLGSPTVNQCNLLVKPRVMKTPDEERDVAEHKSRRKRPSEAHWVIRSTR